MTDYFDTDREQFYEMFPGVKTFQLFDDKKQGLPPKIFHLNTGRHMPVQWVWRIEDLNRQGMGIYMCINETDGIGRKKDNVKCIRAVFADFDGAPLARVWDFNPSLVVESSSGKYHAYWMTHHIPLEAFKAIQQGIAHKFNSDPKVHDLPRVLRVPGFYHMKADPYMVRIIHKCDIKYAFWELQEMFPPAPVEQWSAPEYQKQYGSPQDGEFNGNYGTSAGNRNCHVAKRIGGMIKRNLPWVTIEQEAIKEAMACNPPLPESETRLILRSMRRYV